MIIIGITGTIGAGKGTIVDYLVEKYDYNHFSVRSYLTNIIEKQGLPLNRDTMVSIANGLRKKNNNPSYIVEQLFLLAAESGKNSIIESIRTPGEITTLRKLGRFYLLAVNADPKVRYERIIERKSETDFISYETFLENEKREMTSTDENKQNLSKCIAQADFTLNNDKSREELYKQIDALVLSIK